MKTCPTCGRSFSPKRPGLTFCGRSCSTKSYAPKPVPIAERFWQRVDRSGGPSACWPWTGARDPNGYGRVSVERRARLAHRIAYQLATGTTLAPGVSLCHRCDNPPCVNPEHLFQGTQADNMADAAHKGRTRKRIPERHRFDVCFYAACGFTTAELARDYGVTRGAIVNILKEAAKWTSTSSIQNAS